jgi:hypothetical protein
LAQAAKASSSSVTPMIAITRFLDPERDIPCSVGRLVETTVKRDRLPSALCNQVESSKFLGFLFWWLDTR